MKRPRATAPVGILSPIERKALTECRHSGGLYKQNGYWHGSADGKPISGNTVANLSREGLLTLTKNGPSGSARLTERGNWFAETLVSSENKVLE